MRQVSGLMILKRKTYISIASNLIIVHNCFGLPFLFVEGLLSTGPIPSSFYILVEMGLPLHLFSSIHFGGTRPDLYKKTRPCRFEMNLIMFRLNSDTFRGIFGLPWQNQNES